MPEGFYYIKKFNPTSNYYLSLGINYRNLSDQKKSTFRDLGGDIFIHGECVTIGCLPMTNDFIKEIYLLAVYARNKGQSKIPVYIFPLEMTDKNMSEYLLKNQKNKGLIIFWNNLKIGYDSFVKTTKELYVGVSANGNYTYS